MARAPHTPAEHTATARTLVRPLRRDVGSPYSPSEVEALAEAIYNVSQAVDQLAALYEQLGAMGRKYV